MEELKKGQDLALKGPKAKEALKKFYKQMELWSIALPPAKPLILDFGLGDFEHTGLIECWIANEMEAGYCGKYLFVFDGQTCPLHKHKSKHETFFVVKGRVSMKFDGGCKEMVAGDVLPVPRDKIHSFKGIGSALLLELSTPCEIDDNYFDNVSIPIGGNYCKTKEVK